MAVTSHAGIRSYTPVIARIDSPTFANLPASAPVEEIEGVRLDQSERGARTRRAAPAGTKSVIEIATEIVQKDAAEEQLRDLPVAHNSLIASRIIAARRLLREEAIGRDDEELLDLANQLHKKVQDQPEDQEAAQRSQALYAQEAMVWGERNGAAALNLAPEIVAQAYEDAWSLALNPPPPPVFKTRLELAAEGDPARLVRQLAEEEAYAPSSNVANFSSGILFASKEKQIQWLAGHSFITKKYYTQFAGYIDKHLDRLCTAKAFSIAQAAGVERLALEHKPEQAWSIKLDKLVFDPRKGLNATNSATGHILRMPDDKFILVTADGGLAPLERPASAQDDSWLQHLETTQKILAAYGINNAASGYGVVRKPVEVSSVKEVMTDSIRRAALAEIDQWKKDNYNASTLDKVLRLIVPFYETAHNVKNDPGYQLTFGDVAVDMLSLGLTIATIGASAGPVKAISAGVKAARALQGASVAARASAGIRAALAGLKTGTFLQIAGRELVDFVVPVFTAKNIAQAATKGGSALAREGLSAMARRVNMTVANASDGAGLLDRIYESLHRTSHIPTSPAAAKALIDRNATMAIPPQLYRGQMIQGEKGFLTSRWGKVDAAARDDYLAACIRHSSRTGGSEGEVLSLTADIDVAKRFARGRKDSKVLTIDTTMEPGNFRTIEDILKNDGPRLVQSGKISAATLASAIKHAINQAEKEVFYVMGSVPDALVTIKPDRVVRAVWG